MSSYLHPRKHVGAEQMTWKDPIVSKVRKIREDYAAKFNHDLDAIYDDLKKWEENSGREYNLPPQKKSLEKAA